MQEVIHDIDIKLLRVFREVARQKSFSLAAEKLNTSLSNVSVNMSQLESRLGMRLCERGVKGFKLTEQGQRVLDAGEDLYSALDVFRNKVGSVSESLKKEFRIGILVEKIVEREMRIPEILAKVEARMPGSNFYLELESAARLKEKVESGELHCAIGYFLDVPQSLLKKYLCTERHLCYCSNKHELFNLSSGEIDLELLKTCKIAGYDDLAEQEKQVVPLFSKYDSCSRTGEGVLALILTGNYVGLLSENFAKAWVNEGVIKLIEKEELELRVDIEVLYQSSRAQEPALQTLLSCIGSFYS